MVRTYFIYLLIVHLDSSILIEPHDTQCCYPIKRDFGEPQNDKDIIMFSATIRRNFDKPQHDKIKIMVSAPIKYLLL